MGARRVRRRGAGRHGQHRGSAGRRARHRPRQQLHQLPPRRFLGADHHLPPALCGDPAAPARTSWSQEGAMNRRALGPLALPALAIMGLGAIGAALPSLGVSSYARTLVYYGAYYLALGQAWNLMSGMTGYVSFAHGALAGIRSDAAVVALNAELPVVAGLGCGGLASPLA